MTDFAASLRLLELRTLDASIAKGEQLMQRTKHADRKRRTRALILIGAAAERAGADHLAPEEIEAVLAHYVETGGERKLKAFISSRVSSAPEDRAGGSAASRQNRSGGRFDVHQSETVQ